ncbi:MAG: hypothetical protein JWO03_2773 [Bacteroidetes bacterium]|nr:hypothetical protein [Bacteroidota bacterium]
MNKIIKLEELAQFIAVVVALYYLPVQFSWWAWIGIFLLPDLGMLGYLVNTSTGAVTYNLLHHKLIALAVLGVGWYLGLPYMTMAGLVLYGHSSMDRMLGYGLKYFDAFKHTHIGMIG